MKPYQAGDWVLALTSIGETGLFEEGKFWEHARKGDLGRVLESDSDTITVEFERTGTISDDCWPSEIQWLCNYNGSVTDPSCTSLQIQDLRSKIESVRKSEVASGK